MEKFEAGLQLRGSEVKSLRGSAADLSGSYARLEPGECWLVGAKIAPYAMAREGGIRHNGSEPTAWESIEGVRYDDA